MSGRLTWRDALFVAARGGSSDRLRWGATAFGALVLAFVCASALTLLTIPFRESSWHDNPGPFGWTTLSDRGTVAGRAVAFLVLLVPVLIFLGQAARIGMPVRVRRLAALRAAGASPRDLRRVGGAESVLSSAVGSLLGVAAFLRAWRAAPRLWRMEVLDWVEQDGGDPVARVISVPVLPQVSIPWWIAVGALALSMMLAVVTAASLRPRRITGAGRQRTKGGLFLVGVSLVLLAALFLGPSRVGREWHSATTTFVLVLLALGSLVSWVGGWLVLAPSVTYLLGKRVSRSTSSPALLLAGRRMMQHSRATSRPTMALQLLAVLAASNLVLRPALLSDAGRSGPANSREIVALITSIGNLLSALLVITIVLAGVSLLLATVEALMWRRRSTARQVFAGVPRGVLRRAMVVESAVPTAVVTTLSLIVTAVIETLVVPRHLLPGGFPWLGVLGTSAGFIALVLAASWLAARAINSATDVRELRTT